MNDYTVIHYGYVLTEKETTIQAESLDAAIEQAETLDIRTPEVVEVDGVTFRAHPEHGCFYELDDPDPNGSIGRLWMPMNLDGSPDVGSLGAIEVRYEDA